MKIELSWEERQVLVDLLSSEIKDVKRGVSVYGDADAQLERIELMESIRRKVDD